MKSESGLFPNAEIAEIAGNETPGTENGWATTLRVDRGLSFQLGGLRRLQRGRLIKLLHRIVRPPR
jgi:hypothetical protein